MRKTIIYMYLLYVIGNHLDKNCLISYPPLTPMPRSFSSFHKFDRFFFSTLYNIFIFSTAILYIRVLNFRSFSSRVKRVFYGRKNIYYILYVYNLSQSQQTYTYIHNYIPYTRALIYYIYNILPKILNTNRCECKM